MEAERLGDHLDVRGQPSGDGESDVPDQEGTLKLDTRTPGLVKFSAKRKPGLFGDDFSLPQKRTHQFAAVTMLFRLETPYSTQGQCSVERFEEQFPARPSCFFNDTLTTLNCR